MVSHFYYLFLSPRICWSLPRKLAVEHFTRANGIIWAETNNVKIFPFAVNILGVEASEASIISRFSGGFMAGLLLLLLSIVFWRLCKKKGKGIYFCFFAVTLGFSFTGFTESIFEGFLLKYHRSTIETIILSLFVVALPIILSLHHSQSKSRSI